MKNPNLCELTFSFVVICLPSFTFPKVPSPIDFPKMYWPTFLSFGASLISTGFLFAIFRIWFESEMQVLITYSLLLSTSSPSLPWEERACEATTAWPLFRKLIIVAFPDGFGSTLLRRSLAVWFKWKPSPFMMLDGTGMMGLMGSDRALILVVLIGPPLPCFCAQQRLVSHFPLAPLQGLLQILGGHVQESVLYL